MMQPANGQNRGQRHPAEYEVVIPDLSRHGERMRKKIHMKEQPVESRRINLLIQRSTNPIFC
jgi:hypothetical protein